MLTRPAGIVVAIVLVASCGSAGSAAPPASPRAASTVLAALVEKGRAPKTGYERARFGRAWADVDHNGCDTRNDMLNRDLVDRQWRSGTHGCVVVAGRLRDPYTGESLTFTKARADAVQIDHVVALSNAWQTGAAPWNATRRTEFANDPLNLLAVSGRANQAKGDGDAATWLPPNRSGRCAYVARQVAVKAKWALWTTPAEHAAMVRVLAPCPRQALPA